MNQYGTWHGGGPWSKPHCARWGPSYPPRKGGAPTPQFSYNVHCGQTAACIRIPLGTEVGLSLGDILLDGNHQQLPLAYRCTDPQFSANVRCGQMTGWIKMQLGTDVNLGPGDVMLDGVAAPPQKKGTAPSFRPMSLWPNGWMDEDATWYESRSRPKSHCVRQRPSSPPAKGAQQSPYIRPISIVAMVAHISYC